MLKLNAIVISVNPENFIPSYKLQDKGLACNKLCNLVDEIFLNFGFKITYHCEALGYDDVSIIFDKYTLSNVQLKALAKIIESKMSKPMIDSELKVYVEEYEKDEDGSISMPVGMINY